MRRMEPSSDYVNEELPQASFPSNSPNDMLLLHIMAIALDDIFQHGPHFKRCVAGDRRDGL